ncbi:MAG: GNAT family N-acetyltransferase [Phyllobacteriaceae bacterium]|nr:GNAT family N-acetyltransferase [Phyllobacteriaceae bacterium]
MTSVDVVRLGSCHAADLARLLAEHVQERRGGSPPRPDRYWAEKLLADPRIRLFGARLDGNLIGYAVVHELTDCLTGLETGLLEAVFVRPEFRGRGGGRELLAAIADEGRRSAWSRVRWIVEEDGRRSSLPERLAGTEPATLHVVPMVRQ